MTDRTPETILAEWRTAESELDPDDVDPGLLARIEALRSEHADAVASREQEARELAQPPTHWRPA